MIIHSCHPRPFSADMMAMGAILLFCASISIVGLIAVRIEKRNAKKNRKRISLDPNDAP